MLCVQMQRTLLVVALLAGVCAVAAIQARGCEPNCDQACSGSACTLAPPTLKNPQPAVIVQDFPPPHPNIGRSRLVCDNQPCGEESSSSGSSSSGSSSSSFSSSSSSGSSKSSSSGSSSDDDDDDDESSSLSSNSKSSSSKSSESSSRSRSEESSGSRSEESSRSRSEDSSRSEESSRRKGEESSEESSRLSLEAVASRTKTLELKMEAVEKSVREIAKKVSPTRN